MISAPLFMVGGLQIWPLARRPTASLALLVLRRFAAVGRKLREGAFLFEDPA